MKIMKYSTVSVIFILVCCAWLVKDDTVSKAFAHAEKQTHVMLKEVDAQLEKNPSTDKTSGPIAPRTLKAGELVLVPSRDWTSGFFAGELWYLYEHTNKEEWRSAAKTFTAKMEQEKWNGKTHDMGFKMYCTYGNGYRLTQDPAYKDILIQSAKTLSTRFRPITGVMRSWDHSRDKWSFPVIIDNMMNLELLFFATRVTGDSSFYKIAVSHAKTTMKNHYRPDYSSYHVLEYDTITGKVLKKNTHQGYSHESAWARGQAWGLYAYAMCYRETRDKAFLQHAENIEGFIFNHPNMPADLIPYWDFNAPGIPNEPRDASAAAVIASGLYELSMYSKKGKEYRAKADKVLENLSVSYTSPIGENKGFILLHSTGSKPSNSEVDVPLSYADYYFLEALMRKEKLDKSRKQKAKSKNVKQKANRTLLKKKIFAFSPEGATCL
jgi:unsaturated chondroitin disaccharide hydrolase